MLANPTSIAEMRSAAPRLQSTATLAVGTVAALSAAVSVVAALLRVTIGETLLRSGPLVSVAVRWRVGSYLAFTENPPLHSTACADSTLFLRLRLPGAAM